MDAMQQYVELFIKLYCLSGIATAFLYAMMPQRQWSGFLSCLLVAPLVWFLTVRVYWRQR
ncbi:hypothetical protein B5V02_19480 [Mesorhizobium kowhaii]|uniref:Uncharacterized protein n=1 Tax=Mesorhizobium kowhaii TaxID=1300272 RepID=A0A2W7C1C5_9HYPH|nr:hypothetical protein B5V02_19480 [Mesorhizobium kowhaii]